MTGSVDAREIVPSAIVLRLLGEGPACKPVIVVQTVELVGLNSRDLFRDRTERRQRVEVERRQLIRNHSLELIVNGLAFGIVKLYRAFLEKLIDARALQTGNVLLAVANQLRLATQVWIDAATTIGSK